MIIHFQTKYTGAVPGVGLKRRELNVIMKRAWYYIGVYWHRFFRPKHFTQAGAREYGYKPRRGQRGSGFGLFKESYTGRKLKKWGHTNPLVWKGLARDLTAIQDVRPTSKGVRIVMGAAQKLNWRHPKSDIYMAEEMRRVSIGERKVLIRIFDRFMDKAIKAIHTTKTVRS